MPSSGILLENLIEPYLESRSLHLVDSTLVQEKRYLLRLLASLNEQGVTEVRAIREEHIARYHAILSGLPNPRGGCLSSSFLQQALLCARCFLVWARERGLLLWNFSDLVIPKRDDGLPHVVPTVGEMSRLLELPNAGCPTGQRDRLILELLYVLGLRLGECVRLDLHDADLVAATLAVMGKGGHQRLVPLSSTVRASLLDYLTEGRPQLSPHPTEKAILVSGKTGQRLGGQSVGLRVKYYAAKLGLRMSAHQLRHACATHLLEGGAELPYIARLLGHQRLETTKRYARVTPLELAREHRRCHPRALGDGGPT